MGWFWNSDEDKNKNNHHQQTVSPNSMEVHSTFNTYSSSRSCHSDPEDPEYMICKEKVNDGKNTTIKETRVKASDQFGHTTFVNPNLFSPFFGSFLSGLQQSEKVLNSRMNQLEQEFGQDFDKIFGAFMPFFTMIDPQAMKNFQPNARNFQNVQNPINPQREHSHNYKSNQNNSYFTTAEKDYEIKDL